MKKISIFVILALLLTSISLFAKWTHDRQTGRVELGSVTADDAWIAGKNWSTRGVLVVDSIGFTAEGYNATTGDYVGTDTTVFFVLRAITFGADTETLAVYNSKHDTITAVT